MGTAQQSVGPAKEVPGARKGGTVQVYQETDFSTWTRVRSTSPTAVSSPSSSTVA